MSNYVIIWEFEVHPDQTKKFIRYYGPDGDWAELFRRSSGYIGTLLLNDETNPDRFLTLDRWTSREPHDAFRSQFAADYDALDRICEAFIHHEVDLGTFLQFASSEPAP